MSGARSQSLLAKGKLFEVSPFHVETGDRIGFLHEDKAAAIGRLMAVDGQRDPIKVVANKGDVDKPWRLVTGMHRTIGAKIEGLTLWAIEVSGKPEELADLEASENLHRRPLAPLERAKFVHALCQAARERIAREHGDLKQQQIAVRSRWARVEELPEAADLDALALAFADAERDLFAETGVFPVADPVGAEPELADGETLDLSGPIEREDGSWSRDWIVHRWLELFAPDKLYARLNGEQVTYPYTLAQFRTDWPDVAARRTAFRQMDDEWGVVEVDQVAPPEADVEQVAEPDGIEKDVDGRWRETWALRDRTAEELAGAKVAAKATVMDNVQNAFLAGFSPATGALAGHTLQVRDADDRTNWLASLSAYQVAIAGGAGDVAGAVFRTAANDTVTTTFTAAAATLLAMFEWAKAIMEASWQKKDAIDAAGSFTALALISTDLE